MAVSGAAGRAAALHRSPVHGFSKQAETQLTVLTGLGIEGDAHCGATVRHRSRVAADPAQPNLRQVHLLHMEMIDAINAQGFDISPGDIGENITTAGIDLLALPRHTRLHIGANVILSLTGLRNPCAQLDNFQPGLTQAFLGRGTDGALVRKSGVMAIVLEGGVVHAGDTIRIEMPAPPLKSLERV
ncbi:MAG: MOSC domain-containing protein [Rhizobiaceae bacterium]|nr:MOSC domain-containing protein [Rhizobiaceae bacterium]